MPRAVRYAALPARTLISSMRAWRSGQQMCKACGRPQNEVDYTVSDAAWSAVVPARWRHWALCLACFEEFAARRHLVTVKVFLVNGP